MAVAIYEQFKVMGMRPNVYTYAIMIKAYCKNGCLDEAFDLAREMEREGVVLDAFTCTTLIEGLCLHGKSSLGYELLQTWWNDRVPINAFGYNVVIRGFCNEMKFQEAEDVLVEMGRHGVAPNMISSNMISYGSLINGYCKADNLLRALCIHNEMVLKGMKTDHSGKVEEALRLFEEMKGRNMVPDKIHYTHLIHGYCLQRKLHDAMKVFKEMKEMGSEPDVIMCNILVGAFARNGLIQKISWLIWRTKVSNTHRIIIEGLCKGGKVKEAEAFLSDLDEKFIDSLSALVNGYCESDYIGKAYDLFINLSKTGILVNESACAKLLYSLCEARDVEKAFIVFQILWNSDVILGEIVYVKLVAALCRVGNMKRARYVFDALVGRGLTPNVITQTIMMNRIVNR
ncbi:LOW QUALITY PROTEIN: hypothetical protein Sjap_000631 [Stephania japonica]|uniref:Pentatricopeptide repeat-containing protein n=1 Tax=Stephania japonica TaxID=461633 RepID=A0AAP0KIF4_9MAGN